MSATAKTLVQQRHNLLGAQCPYCHEPTMANHLFCRACGASQIIPEVDRAFCPFCGLRVSQGQEFCHECCGYLLPEKTTGQEPPAPPFLERCFSQVRGLVNRYLRVALMVGGLVMVFIVFLSLSKTAIFPPAFEQSEKQPAGQGTPVAKETEPSQVFFQSPPVQSPVPNVELSVRSQLSQVLSQIRKAQMDKDIDLFMSAFSPYFQGLEEKRQKILRIWQLYDFVDMNFEIKDIQELDNNTASVNVYWQIEAKNKNTQEIRQSIKSYSVTFSKEGDKWLIKDEL